MAKIILIPLFVVIFTFMSTFRLWQRHQIDVNNNQTTENIIHYDNRSITISDMKAENKSSLNIFLKLKKRDIKDSVTDNNEHLEGHEDDSNDQDDQYGFIRWTVFISFIFIPVIMISLVLLLTRNRKKKNKSTVSSLEYPIKLIPTMPSDHFFPSLNIVQMDPKPPHYHLDTETTVKFLQTSQLYHPQSGLLFQFLPNLLFDPLKHCNIRTDNGQFEPTSPNQVYSSFTNEVFERYRFMAYNPIRELFFLPDDDSLEVIPRLPTHQVPEEYVHTYQHLLLEESKKEKPKKIEKKGPAPLLVDKRDFSKPQTADFRETPRSRLPLSLKKQDIDEQSNYTDALSTVFVNK